jgi:monovalent cation/hydrogen antiporter
VITLAMGVILLSLLLASVALPLLTRGLVFSPPAPKSAEEADAHLAANEAAVRQLEVSRDAMAPDAPDRDARLNAVAELIEHYRIGGDALAAEAAAIMREFKLVALKAERDELYRRRMARELSDDAHLRLLRAIDVKETGLG